jgi:hypothetical protein
VAGRAGGCWLGVELRVAGNDVVGWVRAEELVMLAGADLEVMAALGRQGQERSWWDVWARGWCGEVAGQERGVDEEAEGAGCVGWYAPVRVQDESMGRRKGTVVQVWMVLVAVGWDAGQYTGAVGRAGQQTWRLEGMRRQQLRRMVVRQVEAEDSVELVAGGELLEEWDGAGDRHEDTEWRAEQVKELDRRRRGDGEMEGRDKDFDRG